MLAHPILSNRHSTPLIRIFLCYFSVYVYRNPKDVCVSLYFHFMNMSNANPEGFPPLPFDHFFEMFMGPSETSE